MAGVTPQPGTNVSVPTGGVPVEAIPDNPQGGYIVNPYSAVDQGIDPAAPEVLYVNAVEDASLQGNGTNFALYPGQSWNVIPGQTTRTSVTAATSGHKFSAIWW